MKITNKHNLPEPLVKAVTNQSHSKEGADYSVTELIKPPRIGALEKKYADVLEEDASDRLWSLMGQMGHKVISQAADSGITEHRFHAVVGSKKVSGQVDCYVQEHEILDYKFTSIWAVKDGVKPEWEQQLNCYKFLAEENGVEVKELKIIAILRDWNINEAKRNPTLPQSQVVVLPVRVWPKQIILNWMTQRIAMHEAARAGNLPNCTPDEMWERPETYAAKKRGNQRASKVEDTKLDIGRWIASQPKPSEFEIEVRPGERPRCENYCSVGAAGFCEQFNQWKRERPTP